MTGYRGILPTDRTHRVLFWNSYFFPTYSPSLFACDTTLTAKILLKFQTGFPLFRAIAIDGHLLVGQSDCQLAASHIWAHISIEPVIYVCRTRATRSREPSFIWRSIFISISFSAASLLLNHILNAFLLLLFTMSSDGTNFTAPLLPLLWVVHLYVDIALIESNFMSFIIWKTEWQWICFAHVMQPLDEDALLL